MLCIKKIFLFFKKVWVWVTNIGMKSRHVDGFLDAATWFSQYTKNKYDDKIFDRLKGVKEAWDQHTEEMNPTEKLHTAKSISEDQTFLKGVRAEWDPKDGSGTLSFGPVSIDL